MSPGRFTSVNRMFDRQAGGQPSQRFAGVGNRLDLEALLLERLDRDIADLRLVLDQQHRGPLFDRRRHVDHLHPPWPASPRRDRQCANARMVWMLRKVEVIVTKAGLIGLPALPIVNDAESVSAIFATCVTRARLLSMAVARSAL